MGSIILLFLILVLLIQFPTVQNYIKNQAVTFIEGKIKTPVHINRLEIGLPKKIILRGFYFEDQQQDTLLSGERLAVDISLFKLLRNTVEINSIELEGVIANITRDRDSVFNFDYIIEAFAPETPDTTTAMTVSIDKVNLDRIKFQMDDALTKTGLKLQLNHFDTRIRKFDLENMDFDVPEIAVDGFFVKLNRGLVEEVFKIKDSETNKISEDEIGLKLKLGKIALTNIGFDYSSAEENLNSSIILDKLNLKFNDLDLEQELADIETLNLSGLKGMVILNKSSIKTNDSINQTTTSNNWKVILANVNFSELEFRYKDENKIPLAEGLNYADLNLTDLNLNAEDFYYSADTISGNINSFTLQDKSGLHIKSLRTDFLYGSTSAYLKDLYLETPNTILRDKIVLGYPSIESLGDQLENLEIDANLENSSIGFRDILLLAPNLKETPPFKSYPNAVLRINGKATGKIDNLEIANLEVSGIGNTSLSASGIITGLPEVKTAYYDLNIQNFSSTSRDIEQFVPKGSIPDNILLPEKLAVNGIFKGTTTSFNTDLNLQSSSGNGQIVADLELSQKNREKYKADIVLNNFDLGRFIKNDSIGNISLNAKVNGTGFEPKSANATASGTLTKAGYNSYLYQDLKFNGKIENGLFNAKAVMGDKNLDFDLVANGSFKGEYPSVQLTANLEKMVLDSLNLYASPLKLKAKITADLATADPDYLNGKVFLTDIVAENAVQQFLLDSISIRSTASAAGDSIQFKSQFINAKLKGKYQLTQIGTALINSVSHYYNLSPSAEKIESQPQEFSFDLTINNDPILNQLEPKLKLLEPILVSGRYNSRNDSISATGSIPALKYLDYKITNAQFSLATENDALNYNLVIDDVDSAQLKLFRTELSGTVENDVIAYQFQIDDIKNEPHYRVAGIMTARENATLFSLDPDALLLNYESWNIPKNNSIKISEEGIWAGNFELSHNQSAVRINSQTAEPDSPLNVNFNNFEIETISNMISKDTLLAGGNINGDVILRDLKTAPQFNSDLTIEDFNFKKDTLGNIRMLVDNQTENTLKADINITGKGNSVELRGLYNTEVGNLDFNLDLQHLNLKSIQGFSFGAINESTGYLSGNFSINGTLEKPVILGDLKFNEVGFRLARLNSYFQSMNDRISFNRENIQFDQFTVFDEAKNKLTINGSLQTADYIDYNFNLSVNATNFKAISSTAKENDLYYGDLFLDANLNIGGDLESPVVSGNIRINEDSKLTVVLPQEDPSIADREGIVEFIDEKSRLLAETERMKEVLNTSEIQGMDVSVIIETDKEAELTLIIDEGNGDYLRLKGEAQLTAGIDPSGKTSLTGRYEFTDGAYEMSFNFIKRRFVIEKGSYILWTGEPTTADVNITAIYETEAAPIDLLENQLGNLTAGTRNTYKQRLPFQTILKMKGELLKPELSFDIRLPEGNYNVSGDVLNNTRIKLAQLRQQPSELNKQVFALLLLNRFVGENPFASEAGGAGAEALARQSVSKILSQQLNDLASDLISGVELEFDLESYEDYTTGQREYATDLNVGLSKQLLNERLKVTIGSNFGLEGPQQSNRNATNIAGDIELDYKLSKDGRYILRAYRKNQYQVALQGQIIETGIAFIITMDYNKFKELFRKKATSLK